MKASMDITERLRALYVEHGTNYVQEAADEIERLRNSLSEVKSERDNLYRAVKWYADGSHFNLPDWEDVDEPNWLFPPGELETTKTDNTPFDPKVGPKPAETVTVDLAMDWGVEDGGIARYVLAGGVIPPDFAESDDDAPLRLPPDAKPLEAPK